MGGKDVEDDTRGDRINVGKDGSNGCTEGNLLGEWVGIEVWERREGNSRGGRAGAKGNGCRRRGCGSGDDGSWGKLHHGGEVGGNKRNGAGGGFWCNRYRSHVTKDGSVVRLCV